MPRRNGRSAYYKRLQLFMRFRRVFGEKVFKRRGKFKVGERYGGG